MLGRLLNRECVPVYQVLHLTKMKQNRTFLKVSRIVLIADIEIE